MVVVRVAAAAAATAKDERGPEREGELRKGGKRRREEGGRG